MADAGKTTLVVAITLVIGLLCLIGSVLGFYHESSKDKFLQIDDASSKIFPFKTDPDIPSNSMLTSTKGQKGEKGDRVCKTISIMIGI